MKKFIAAFDGLHFSESTMNYAISLALQNGAYLVGVFLEDIMRHSYGYADITKYEGERLDAVLNDLNEKDEEERKESVEKFEAACQEAGVKYSVHRDRNVALLEILEESIYADLLIISASETLTRLEEKLPTRFLRDLLNEVQCPVLVVPETYKAVDKIVLLYDGEPSSVYAVKAFSYVFDALKIFDTEVVSVRELDESTHLPHNRLIKEFVKRHYPKAEYVVLSGLFAENEIPDYLKRLKKNPVIVLGAYRRSRVSRLFRPSMADYLIQRLKLPLFIAHNKS
jgi:nucleotide-binding universal stress UspA family protein